MERLRVRSRNGPARDDPVRHPRHPPLCAKRPAVSPPVRMKFTVNWLRELVHLLENPEEIADLLTRAGVEAQHIETRGARIDKVIVSSLTASSGHQYDDPLYLHDLDEVNGARIENSRQEDRRNHHRNARMSLFLRAQDRQRYGRTESAVATYQD